VLLGAIVLGLIAGLLTGGSIGRLASVRLRYIWLIFAALALRSGIDLAAGAGIALPDGLRILTLLLAYSLLVVGLAANRTYPGILLALVGVMSNGVVVLLNGGRMPIWEPSLAAAGFTAADVSPALHALLPAGLDASFFFHLGPLSDVIPIPFPIVQNVASIGDVFLSAGLAFFLFAAVIGQPTWMEAAGPDGAPVDGGRRWSIGVGALRGTTASAGRPFLARTMAESASLERASMLGGSGGGMSAAAIGASAGGAPSIGRRVLSHPYARLALDGDFSALWVGQLVSFFGDRIHQIAIAFLVLGVTGSPLAVSAVFLAAFLPNLLLGPIAGVLVDRWDHQEVMVVSDLVRAAMVLLIPVVAAVNVLLVYPLVFGLTSVTIFFRPARTAVIPRIVGSDELVTANSAMWVGETLADVVGYPVAGVLVAFLGSALALAFWLDAATYVASAVLIATMAIPPVARAAGSAVGAGLHGVMADLRAGWRFLRGEAVLLANTLQGAIAQVSVGATIALTPVYAAQVLDLGRLDGSTAYALLETGVGVGNLIGGFAVGLVGMRLAKGRMVIAGFTIYGLCVIGLGLTGNVAVAIGLMLGCGIANMIYVIPSQTLFQERTPPELMGRVVSFRFALVTASMSAAMAAAGLLAAGLGVPTVLAISGAITLAAGLAGLLTPAVRDA
jgi:MFS family permease